MLKDFFSSLFLFVIITNMELKRVGDIPVYLNPSEDEQLLVISSGGVVVEASIDGEIADPEIVFTSDEPFAYGDAINADQVVVNAVSEERSIYAETVEAGKPVTISTRQQKQSRFNLVVAQAIDRAINSFE
jgi:hypothetical protein